MRLENLEDQFLLTHPRGAGDFQVGADLGEMLDTHFLHLGDVEAGAPLFGKGVLGGLGGDVWLRGGLVAATPVGSVTFVTGHAGYSKRGGLGCLGLGKAGR